MNQRLTLLLAAMLANFSAFAQQPTSAYNFRTLVSKGTTIGGHVLTPDTVIENAALSDSGEMCFVVRWKYEDKDRVGVFTSKQFLASDGATIDGRLLTGISATSLSINTEGLCAYEATFGNALGIFVSQKFIVALSKAGSADDFSLSDNGAISLMAAIAAPITAPQTAQAKRRTWLPTGIYARLPDVINRKINGSDKVPVAIDPRIPAQQGPMPTQQRPQPIARAAVPIPRPCSLPEFPYPPSWNIGDSTIGPITNHLFDPAKGKTFDSRFFGRMGPFRSIQCGADGKPLTITFGDSAGHYEIYTPNGFLTRTKADGFLDLPGITANVLPALLVRGDTSVRINKRGEILLPVMTEKDGPTILVATPRH